MQLQRRILRDMLRDKVSTRIKLWRAEVEDDVQLVRATIRYQLEQEALRDNRGLALQRAIMVVVWQRQLLSRGSQFHAMRFNYMRHAFRLEVLRKHAVLRS